TRGFNPERDGEMRFSRTDGAGENDVVGASDPLTASELVDLCCADASIGRSEVEGVERLHLWKTRVVETVSYRRIAARRLLRGEHLVQIIFVSPVLLSRLTRESFVDASESRHLERACLRSDELAGNG